LLGRYAAFRRETGSIDRLVSEASRDFDRPRALWENSAVLWLTISRGDRPRSLNCCTSGRAGTGVRSTGSSLWSTTNSTSSRRGTARTSYRGGRASRRRRSSTRAYLKLVDQNRVDWQNRAHFFRESPRRLMRRILLDDAPSPAPAEAPAGGPAAGASRRTCPASRRSRRRWISSICCSSIAPLQELEALESRSSPDRRAAVLRRLDRRGDRPSPSDRRPRQSSANGPSPRAGCTARLTRAADQTPLSPFFFRLGRAYRRTMNSHMSRSDWERVKRIASDAWALAPGGPRVVCPCRPAQGDDGLQREVMSAPRIDARSRRSLRAGPPPRASPSSATRCTSTRQSSRVSASGAWTVLRQPRSRRHGHGLSGRGARAPTFEQRAAIKIVRGAAADLLLRRRFEEGAPDSGDARPSAHRAGSSTAARPSSACRISPSSTWRASRSTTYCEARAPRPSSAARRLPARLRRRFITPHQRLVRPSRSQAIEHLRNGRRHSEAAGLRQSRRSSRADGPADVTPHALSGLLHARVAPVPSSCGGEPITTAQRTSTRSASLPVPPASRGNSPYRDVGGRTPAL